MKYKLILFIVVIFVSLLLVYLHTQTERFGCQISAVDWRAAGGNCRIKWWVISAKTELDELSGLTYHPQRNTLFVVADEGSLYETAHRWQTSPALSNSKQADFEGVTVNPQTGFAVRGY